METIIVKVGKKYSFIKMDEIVWIESDKGYLKIHINNNYFTLKMTLHAIMKKLNSKKFIRVNRSNIINVFKIKEMIDSQKSNDYTVILNDNTKLKWARFYRKNFPSLLLLK